MTIQFSKRSQEHLDKTHDDLVRVWHNVARRTDIDFGLYESERSLAIQHDMWVNKKSNANGSKGSRSAHNMTKAMGNDIVLYPPSNPKFNDDRWHYINYVHFTQHVRAAAVEEKVAVMWGGAFSAEGHPHPLDLRDWHGPIVELYNAARAKGSYLDCPHYQLAVDVNDNNFDPADYGCEWLRS